MTIRIDDDIPPPMDIRQSRKRTSKTSHPAASFIAALKFVSTIQKKNNYCRISGHWVATSNGIITIAHPIDENLNACPQTFLLIDALKKAAKDLSIVQINNEILSISSGAFRALVPCIVGDMHGPTPAPDPMTVPCRDALRVALGAVASIALDDAVDPVHTTVLLLPGSSCVATNGTTLLECWHAACASDAPPMLVPKQAAVLVGKSPYPLIGIGFSESSVTFHFENGAFLKTQLYNSQTTIFPPYEQMFQPELMKAVKAVQPELMKAVKAVQTYSEDGHIYFEGNAVQSKQSTEAASTYRIAGLPSRMAFSAKLLCSVEHAFKFADFDTERNLVTFYGDDLPIRGILMGVDFPKIADDDIPF